MNKPYQLDKWECAVIRAFKHGTSDNPLTINQLLEIWSERCGMDVEYVHLEYITEHMFEVARKLNLFDEYDGKLLNFIQSLNPKENWKYVCRANPHKKDENDFDMILLSRLDSLFSLTEVSKLNGYVNYLTSIGKEI